MPPMLARFKKVYVHERRYLERFRYGPEHRPYTPSPSLDGKSKYNSPEEKKTPNEWAAAYERLASFKRYPSPEHYLRVLFRLLRGSSLPIPTIRQVATHQLREYVNVFLNTQEKQLADQNARERQQAKVEITLKHLGSGYPLSLSVYYAVAGSHLPLSPLFRYCLATSTVAKLKADNEADEHCEALLSVAKQFEFQAAMEYTLFPGEYDKIYRDVLPEGFCVAACELLESALEQ